jgi:hypothetical protein
MNIQYICNCTIIAKVEMTNHLIIDSSLDINPIKNKLAMDYFFVYLPGIQDIINWLLPISTQLVHKFELSKL